MSYQNLVAEIKKGLPSSNYLLSSSDPFLHNEAVSMIRELIPPAERDFNFHEFDLLSGSNEKVSFEQIIDVLNSVPFFTGRKCVVVANFQKAVKKDLQRLERYLARPSESSLLVLLYSGSVKKEIRDNLKGTKQIVLDIREKEMPSWLKEKAKTKGFGLSDSAADYLLGTIGPDLGMLSSELDKFTLIGKSVVGKDDIVEIIEGKRTYNAFDLIDAIRAKDKEKVFRICSILRETEDSTSLLGALNWQYGQFMGNKNSPQEKNFYHNVFELLNKADVNIKSSGNYYPMELLLIKLLQLSRQR